MNFASILILLGATAAYVPIVLDWPKVASDYKAALKDRLKAAFDTSWWAGFLLGLSCYLSFPAGLLQFRIAGDLTDRTKRRKRIDVWILSWAALTPVCLFLIPKISIALVILPVWRLFDMLQVLLWLLLLDAKPQSTGRSASFLILHYIETVFIFACVYVSLHYLCAKCAAFPPGEALYFSMSNATTLGYSEFRPLAVPMRTAVGLQMLTVFFLIAIAIPHALSGVDKSQEQ